MDAYAYSILSISAVLVLAVFLDVKSYIDLGKSILLGILFLLLPFIFFMNFYTFILAFLSGLTRTNPLLSWAAIFYLITVNGFLLYLLVKCNVLDFYKIKKKPEPVQRRLREGLSAKLLRFAAMSGLIYQGIVAASCIMTILWLVKYGEFLLEGLLHPEVLRGIMFFLLLTPVGFSVGAIISLISLTVAVWWTVQTLFMINAVIRTLPLLGTGKRSPGEYAMRILLSLIPLVNIFSMFRLMSELKRSRSDLYKGIEMKG